MKLSLDHCVLYNGLKHQFQLKQIPLSSNKFRSLDVPSPRQSEVETVMEIKTFLLMQKDHFKLLSSNQLHIYPSRECLQEGRGEMHDYTVLSHDGRGVNTTIFHVLVDGAFISDLLPNEQGEIEGKVDIQLQSDNTELNSSTQGDDSESSIKVRNWEKFHDGVMNFEYFIKNCPFIIPGLDLHLDTGVTDIEAALLNSLNVIFRSLKWELEFEDSLLIEGGNDIVASIVFFREFVV